ALGQELLPARPRFGSRFAVSVIGIRSFAGTHEAVACAVIRHRFIGLASSLHLLDRPWHSCPDTSVLSRVKAVHRSFDAGHSVLIWRRSIKYECRGQIRPIGSETKGLPTAPAESANKQFSIRGGQLQAIVCCRIQIGCDLIWIQMANRFVRFALGKVRRPASIWPHA